MSLTELRGDNEFGLSGAVKIRRIAEGRRESQLSQCSRHLLHRSLSEVSSVCWCSTDRRGLLRGSVNCRVDHRGICYPSDPSAASAVLGRDAVFLGFGCLSRPCSLLLGDARVPRFSFSTSVCMKSTFVVRGSFGGRFCIRAKRKQQRKSIDSTSKCNFCALKPTGLS